MKVTVFRRADQLFDWHAVAPNGRLVAGSVQGYTSRYGAWRAFDAFAVSFLAGVTRVDEL